MFLLSSYGKVFSLVWELSSRKCHGLHFGGLNDLTYGYSYLSALGLIVIYFYYCYFQVYSLFFILIGAWGLVFESLGFNLALRIAAEILCCCSGMLFFRSSLITAKITAESLTHNPYCVTDLTTLPEFK